MNHIFSQIIFTFGFFLSIFARPHAFDDEGEISVPRTPKIHGPSVITLLQKELTDVGVLQCQIEASPTPSVVWLKDGKEIGNGDGAEIYYTTTFNVTEGLTLLTFQEAAYTDKNFYMTGNFTCIAANFLGRVQKLFLVTGGYEEKDAEEDTTKDTTSSDTATTNTSNLVETTKTNLSHHPFPVKSNGSSTSANDDDTANKINADPDSVRFSKPTSKSHNIRGLRGDDGASADDDDDMSIPNSSGNVDHPVKSKRRK